MWSFRCLSMPFGVGATAIIPSEVIRVCLCEKYRGGCFAYVDSFFEKFLDVLNLQVCLLVQQLTTRLNAHVTVNTPLRSLEWNQ